MALWGFFETGYSYWTAMYVYLETANSIHNWGTEKGCRFLCKVMCRRCEYKRAFTNNQQRLVTPIHLDFSCSLFFCLSSDSSFSPHVILHALPSPSLTILSTKNLRLGFWELFTWIDSFSLFWNPCLPKEKREKPLPLHLPQRVQPQDQHKPTPLKNPSHLPRTQQISDSTMTSQRSSGHFHTWAKSPRARCSLAVSRPCLDWVISTKTWQSVQWIWVLMGFWRIWGRGRYVLWQFVQGRRVRCWLWRWCRGVSDMIISHVGGVLVLLESMADGLWDRS